MAFVFKNADAKLWLDNIEAAGTVDERTELTEIYDELDEHDQDALVLIARALLLKKWQRSNI